MGVDHLLERSNLETQLIYCDALIVTRIPGARDAVVNQDERMMICIVGVEAPAWTLIRTTSERVRRMKAKQIAVEAVGGFKVGNVETEVSEPIGAKRPAQ